MKQALPADLGRALFTFQMYGDNSHCAFKPMGYRLIAVASFKIEKAGPS
jgi:hypothetical protein